MSTPMIILKLVDFDHALKEPWHYELSLSCVGWAIRHIDDDTSLCLSRDQALQFIVASESLYGC